MVVAPSAGARLKAVDRGLRIPRGSRSSPPARGCGRSSRVAYSRITSTPSDATGSCSCEGVRPASSQLHNLPQSPLLRQVPHGAIQSRTNGQAHHPPTPDDSNRQRGDEPLRHAARKRLLHRLEHRHAPSRAPPHRTALRSGMNGRCLLHQTGRSPRPRPRLAFVSAEVALQGERDRRSRRTRPVREGAAAPRLARITRWTRVNAPPTGGRDCGRRGDSPGSSETEEQCNVCGVVIAPSSLRC